MLQLRDLMRRLDVTHPRRLINHDGRPQQSVRAVDGKMFGTIYPFEEECFVQLPKWCCGRRRQQVKQRICASTHACDMCCSGFSAAADMNAYTAQFSSCHRSSSNAASRSLGRPLCASEHVFAFMRYAPTHSLQSLQQQAEQEQCPHDVGRSCPSCPRNPGNSHALKKKSHPLWTSNSSDSQHKLAARVSCSWRNRR